LRQTVRHLALVGPTATGKTELSLAAARTLGDVEIVTVDSMQVYRGMDIGTAKPTRAERDGVAHHLLDLAGPHEQFTLARFLAEAHKALAAIEARGRRALLVGGTGLYYQALVDGLEVPGQDDGVRAALEARAADDAGLADLYGELADLDALAASRIEPGNRRRVVRALEVTLATGRPFSSFGSGVFERQAGRGLDVAAAAVWLPRAATARRIERRFAAMAAAGLVEEVERLAAAPGGMSRTARQAIGYKEILDHVEGSGMTLEGGLSRAVDRTRALSRRQRMWFRRDPRISWFGAADNPLAVLPALLSTWTESTRRPHRP
jgi:tRNA dimethylallyltransferase